MNEIPPREACVADIADIMERLAPPHLAEEWDNCGLQVGSPRWPVNTVWVALDPLPAVVRAAAAGGADLLITHHPLILRPLRAIDTDDAIGKVIQTALAARMAIYCAHTNLDCAREGVNQVLAETLGLGNLVPMVPGTVEPSAAPAEISSAGVGMGRVGTLDEPVALTRLADDIKSRLGLRRITKVGDPRLVVRRVAVCSGSGSGLLPAFLRTDAEVYVSGDLRYHDARAVEEAGRALIDVGHFASEHLVIPPLVRQLKRATAQGGWPVRIVPCELEQDPFY